MKCECFRCYFHQNLDQIRTNLVYRPLPRLSYCWPFKFLYRCLILMRRILVLLVTLLMELLVAYYLVLLLVSDCEMFARLEHRVVSGETSTGVNRMLLFCRVTMIRNPALTQHTVADYAVVFAETQKNGRKSEFALFISLVPSKSYTVFTFRRYSCVAGLKAWGNTQGGWLGLSEERWDSWTGVVVRRLYWVLGKRGNVSWNFGE